MWTVCTRITKNQQAFNGEVIKEFLVAEMGQTLVMFTYLCLNLNFPLSSCKLIRDVEMGVQYPGLIGNLTSFVADM